MAGRKSFMTQMVIMDKKLPRHKVEEMKRREEEAMTKKVYEDFVQTFEGANQAGGKAFVRGEIVNQAPTGSRELKNRAAGQLYKPEPIWKPPAAASHPATQTPPSKPKKTKEKKPSMLEIMKEELKNSQQQREERRKIRQQLKEQLGMDSQQLDKIAGTPDDIMLNDSQDPNSTNIYLSNLAANTTEDQVCRMFGAFGPLASVKIMWPRSEDERSRGYLCGFVAYMTRIDAERAVTAMRGKVVNGYEMRMGWGKTVNTPAQPIYIPPAMLEMTLPPPPSGLPFNAQPRTADRELFAFSIPPPGAPPPEDPDERSLFDSMIRNASVKVVIPTERPLLALIHRMVEFVVREGPQFEAIIMSREMNNPAFRFLTDNQSPAHVYYRWKLYSILSGNSTSDWSTKPFRMFKDGSVWIPPRANFFQGGMPVELYGDPAEEFGLSSSKDDRSPRSQDQESPRAPHLSDDERDQLEDIIRHLIPEREKISEAMLFCLENADCASEIVECLTDSMCSSSTAYAKKVARIFLISDILANCSARIMNASAYRNLFESSLQDIFSNLHVTFTNISGRLRAEQFRQRVLACIQAWEDLALYPVDFLVTLQNSFLGIGRTGAPVEEETRNPADLDGDPVIGAQQDADTDTQAPSEDIDGVDVQTFSTDEPEPASTPVIASGGFMKSKWEAIDPEEVVTQAVTSSKWDTLRGPSKWDDGGESTRELENLDGEALDGDDLDGMPLDPGDATSSAPMTEDRRKKLREVEVRVLEYQEDLEGSNVFSRHMINEKVAAFRKKLLAEVDETTTPQQPKPQPSIPPTKKEKEKKSEKKKKHSRSRSRSRSPPRHSSSKKRKRSRSRSPKKSRRR